ncbi:hypothetical protein AGABI2DRAFT_187496 [Agaricus bisporus var. bisporus H97]|uniref:hypothetical protein n=1 Tax=Agaricus bisporus var. bisporus (strain H97 / ATCC MYA-4626 / FGSC 10389) TaxID=936046 RepID=UPI00029F5B17|nr:hypothetical protein AGABI2DRAFT_187496 [Agaricus bisporus var. bisporus H97]EKV44845.1 hypothetical protein AGABI2DRAFT_187496 [Agaricus bisporus var. bisporus H97]
MSTPIPSRPLRTKRNFKALQLPTGPTLNLPPIASPSAGFHKPPPASATDSSATQRSAIRASITKTIAGFSSKSLDLQNEKLIHIREIGQGNGGSVSLVRHRDTQFIMAKKIVLIDAKPSVRKQIVRELQIMHECNSRYIIECYGSYLSDPNICICMEYMDRGSFDRIYKKMGPIQVQVVARVAMSVLEGLTYLYDVHRIIHRDIKPSNILCNTKGEIKLCDFGVSGELINSIANTFVGTSIYMSPERIQGAEYSVKSDVWSLGITLVELALGRFPFSGEEEEGPSDSACHPNNNNNHYAGSTTPKSPNRLPDLDEETYQQHTRKKSRGVSLHGGGMTMSIIELMHHIVREPAPRLPEGRFEKEAEEFVDACLEKEIEMRKTPGVLLNYKWVQDSKLSTFDFATWAQSLEIEA